MKRIPSMVRWNPLPGDVVRVGGEERRIVAVSIDAVSYRQPGCQTFQTCSLLDWSRWCRDGEVVRVAE